MKGKVASGDKRGCIGLAEKGGAMAPPAQFRGKRKQGIEMAGERRSDKGEMGQIALRRAEIMIAAFSRRGTTTRWSQAAPPSAATLRPIRP